MSERRGARDALEVVGSSERRLEAWRSAIAPMSLDEQLERLRVPREDLPLVLGEVRVRCETPDLPWMRLLEGGLARLEGTTAPTSLEQLFAPLATEIVAGSRLPEAFGRRMTAEIGAAFMAVVRTRRALSVGFGSPTEEQRARFLSEMARGGARELLYAHAPLTRRTIERQLRARACVETCISRYREDAHEIGSTFFGGEDVGDIADAEVASEPHEGGASVVVLRFASGRAVVYKPRDLAPEAAYAEIVRAYSGEAERANVVLRRGYGWARWFERCEIDAADRGRVIDELAEIAALHDALGSKDCTAENTIIGDRVRIIDHELLVAAPLFVRRAERQLLEAIGEVPRALGRAGLAPFWTMRSGVLAAQSAWAGVIASRSDIGRAETAFRRARARIRVKREAIRERVEHSLGEARVRVLVRDTGVYRAVLDGLAFGEPARCGVERSLALQRLFSASARTPALWDVVADEVERLEEGDVPRFEVAAAGGALSSCGRMLSWKMPSAIAVAIERIDALDDAGDAARAHELTMSLSLLPNIEPRDLLGESARRIADVVFDGLGPWLFDDALGADDFHPWGGLLGPGIFLSAVDVELARFVEKTLLERLRGGALPPPGHLGSVLHALSTITQVSKNDTAAGLARELLARPHGLPEHHDVIDGLAGYVLGALRLHTILRDETSLQAARRGAEALLAHPQVRGDANVPSGLAHGASGWLLAFTRMHHVTGEQRWLEAAHDARRREDLLRCEHGWLEETGQPEPPRQAWCHGAPGIGLARLALWQNGIADAKADVEHAIDATLPTLDDGVDHACCGILGRVEFLLSAGRALARPVLVKRAIESAKAVAQRSSFRLGHRRRRGEISFFQGLSGIGYQLLRCTNPEAFGSVLGFA
jgi:lantibiotic modifying enzyme